MTKLLWKKMIRDMKRSRAAYLLCILIVAIGFCGGFAEVTDSPVSEAGILNMIPGIDAVEPRLVKEVRVYGFDGDVELHLVSWTDGKMNRPVLSRGSLPAEGKMDKK